MVGCIYIYKTLLSLSFLLFFFSLGRKTINQSKPSPTNQQKKISISIYSSWSSPSSLRGSLLLEQHRLFGYVLFTSPSPINNHNTTNLLIPNPLTPIQLCVNPQGSEFGICRGFEGDAGKPDVGCGPEEVRKNATLPNYSSSRRKISTPRKYFFFY